MVVSYRMLSITSEGRTCTVRYSGEHHSIRSLQMILSRVVPIPIL